VLFVPLDAMAETRRWQFDAVINTPPLQNPVSLSGSFRTAGFCHRREDLSALMVPLDAIEKRAGADADAAASSATLWDDLCPLAADLPDIPPALRDRMPPGARFGVAGLILTLPCLRLLHMLWHDRQLFARCGVSFASSAGLSSRILRHEPEAHCARGSCQQRMSYEQHILGIQTTAM